MLASRLNLETRPWTDFYLTFYIILGIFISFCFKADEFHRALIRVFYLYLSSKFQSCLHEISPTGGHQKYFTKLCNIPWLSWLILQHCDVGEPVNNL